MKKYKELSDAARASFWYALCGVIQKSIAIVVIPIYTRIMGVDAYGEYSVFQSWFVLLFVLTSLGLANYVFNNGMLKYKEDRDGFASAMLGLSGIVALIFLAAFLIFPSFWVSLFGLSTPIVFLLFIRCAITPSYELWSARLRYEFQYRKVVALTLILTLAVPVVSVPVIIFSVDKASAALASQVLVMAIVYAVPFISLLRKKLKLFNKEYWIFALKFNIPLIPSMLATLALQQMDRLIIADIAGDAPAAIYAVAYSIGMVSMFIVSSFDQAYRPWFYQKMEAGIKFSVDKVALLLVGCIGLICFLVSLFAPEILWIFAPAEYSEGVYAVAPVSASIVAVMAFSMYITVEYYYGETKAIPIISIAAAVGNYALNVLMIPLFGFLAAGYITLGCYTVLMLGHAFLCRRCLKRHPDSSASFSISLSLAFVGVIIAGILIIQIVYPWIAGRVALLIVALLIVIANRKKLGSVFR